MNNFAARYLQRLALSFWLGEMLFFAFIFAPRVFKVLPRPMAGDLQNHLFPGYFSVGIVCAIIIIAGQFYLIRKSVKGIYWAKATVAEARGPGRRYGPLIIATLCGTIFAYCLVLIAPRLTELQPLLAQATASAELQAEFAKLHSLSVSLNGIALVGLFILLALI